MYLFIYIYKIKTNTICIYLKIVVLSEEEIHVDAHCEASQQRSAFGAAVHQDIGREASGPPVPWWPLDFTIKLWL